MNIARPSTERTATPDYPEAHEYLDDIERHKGAGHQEPAQVFGVAGHIVHMAAMLFPVLAAEIITDAAKKKAVRIGGVATTVRYEALYGARAVEREPNRRNQPCLRRATPNLQK